MPANDISVIDRTRVPLGYPVELSEMTFASRVANWFEGNTPEWLSGGVARLLSSRGELIDLKMKRQCHSYWCWAAVAEAVAKHFNPGTNCEQCKIARIQLDDPDTCKDVCDTPKLPYNKRCKVVDSLKIIDCYANGPPGNGVVSLADVQQQIDAKRPVCVRVEWRGNNASLNIGAGGAHFLLIVGYGPGTQIALRDPWFGKTGSIKFDVFSTNYQGAKGTWTHTYYTKPGSKNCN